MSRIEQVITEIEEFVNRCKTVALSNSIIKVNKEEFVALLNDLRKLHSHRKLSATRKVYCWMQRIRPKRKYLMQI